MAPKPGPRRRRETQAMTERAHWTAWTAAATELRDAEADEAGAGVSPSHAMAAYTRLKADVILGHLPPGAKLKIDALTERTGFSRGAIRKALSRLTSEDLVIARDQRGYAVARMSVEDLDDLARLRCDIEELALRRSVAAGDVAWEAAVLAAAHRTRRESPSSPYGRPTEAWLRCREWFDDALVAACGSLRLLALRARLREQARRYLFGSMCLVRSDAEDDHGALIDAAFDRDVETLVGWRRSRIHSLASLARKGLASSAGPTSEEPTTGSASTAATAARSRSPRFLKLVTCVVPS